MNKNSMLQALRALDGKLKVNANLLIGGGGAMVLAYDFPVATLDIDGLFYKCAVTEADVHQELIAIADALKIPKDWLNSYFQTFLYTLPKDYDTRLTLVFSGQHLKVLALSMTDLLILKCCAGRDKDVPHAKALIRKGADAEFVRRHIMTLAQNSIPKAREAADFLDDVLDTMESA